jgi:hypothetical protein
MDPLIKSLMLKMRHNRVYTAVTFSRLFGVSEAAVEAALATLIANGQVCSCNNARRNPGYCLTGTPQAQGSQELVSQTSVATAPMARRFDRALSGYGRQFDQQRSLAMLVRR